MSVLGRAAIVVLLGATVGCAGAQPFSAPTPALQVLEEEEPFLYEEPAVARAALDRPGAPGLSDRIVNLITAYEEELVRAEGAQGGALNTVLTLATLAVPVGGMVAPLFVDDPDRVKRIAAISAGVTTALVGVNLLLKPQAKKQAAARCETFLRYALESLRRRWDVTALDQLDETDNEWRAYLSTRTGLEAGRQAAC